MLHVPAELVAGNVLKHLPGVLTLLRDAGYNDEEALRWLYSPDDTLPGTPAEALAATGPPRSSGAPRRWASDSRVVRHLIYLCVLAAAWSACSGSSRCCASACCAGGGGWC